MTPLDFIILTLAASAIVDAWRCGSIFEKRRIYLDAYYLSGRNCEEAVNAVEREQIMTWREDFRIIDRLPNLVLELFTCPFCFSHHTPWILALTCFLPAFYMEGVWVFLLKLPAYSLAATRLGTIINACVPEGAQYEREDIDDSFSKGTGEEEDEHGPPG